LRIIVFCDNDIWENGIEESCYCNKFCCKLEFCIGRGTPATIAAVMPLAK